MIGNDIIDLTFADLSAWQRNRYLDKVCSVNEQALIRGSENPARTLWLLWSMKESAYKVHFHENPKRSLNPISFGCTLTSDSKGIVHVDSEVYETISDLGSHYIHTIAFSAESGQLNIKTGLVTTDQPSGIRKEIEKTLLQYTSQTWKLDVADIKFEKDDKGIPFLRHRGSANSKTQPCSISHHGRYGAYALASSNAAMFKSA